MYAICVPPTFPKAEYRRSHSLGLSFASSRRRRPPIPLDTRPGLRSRIAYYTPFELLYRSVGDELMPKSALIAGGKLRSHAQGRA